jgi:hypothetical protein
MPEVLACLDPVYGARPGSWTAGPLGRPTGRTLGVTVAALVKASAWSRAGSSGGTRLKEHQESA